MSPPVLSGGTVFLARKPNCLKGDSNWHCQSILSSPGAQYPPPAFCFIGSRGGKRQIPEKAFSSVQNVS